MSLRSTLFDWLYGEVFRSASLFVPVPLRREWREEWRSELWHAREAQCAEVPASWSAEWELASFSAGAFADALTLARLHPSALAPPPIRGSVPRCLVVLTALLFASFGVRWLTPATRIPPAPQHASLRLIRQAGTSSSAIPTIPAGQFRMWKARRQHLFDGLAFYQIVPETMRTHSGADVVVPTAHASANLFTLLRLDVQDAVRTIPAHSALPQLILSDRIWSTAFRRDPALFGRVLHLGSTDVVVVGSMRDSAWTLPGRPAAWLLEPDPMLPSSGAGFVLAHLAPAASAFTGTWHLSAPTLDGTAAEYVCQPASPPTHSTLAIFWFTLILACLALPATTSLTLGEYPAHSRQLSVLTRIRHLSFLGAKLLLLLSLAYLLSTDLAHLLPVFRPATSEYIQLGSSFSICLFGLRWALCDHRRRCPVCLGRLTHPAHVGEASRNFLAWHGVELMCSVGHGLLHVPEMQTSWFSTQRWLSLDTSWDVLFRAPALAPPAIP